MLPFYFKEAFRNIISGRPHSFLNVLGLTLGLSCSLFLFKYGQFEWNTDRFHEGVDDIYWATIRATPLSQPEFMTLSDFFKVDYSTFPEVSTSTRIIQYGNDNIEYQEQAIPAQVLVVDSTFLDVFDFPLLSGDKEKVLRNPQDLLLKPSLAKKLFGEVDPMGKEIEFRGKSFLVAGLLGDWPKNSSMDFEVLIPHHAKRHWGRMGLECVRLNAGASIETLNEELEFAAREHSQFPESSIRFIPFADSYFGNSVMSTDILRTGNLRNVYILLLAGTLILGISLFNYVNIFLALLIRQSKVFGIKKVFGAARRELSIEILLQNFLSSFLAVWLASILILYLTPWLQRFTSKPIALSFPEDILLALVLVVGLTILLSFYPIIRIPKLTSITLLQGKFTGIKGTDFRKWVIGIQFGISIILLIAALSFHRQTQFMLKRDLGIERQHIIRTGFDFQEEVNKISFPESDNEEDWEEYQTQRREAQARADVVVSRVVNEIEANPNLSKLSFGDTPLNTHEMPWKNMDGGEYQTMNGMSVTPNIKDLFGFTVLQGRFFDPEQDKSRDDKVVINERAMHHFGFEDLTEARIANSYWGAEKSPFRVIGVIKDFYFQHLSHPISPLVMYYHDDREDSGYLMQVAEGKDEEALAFLQELHKET
ncbi:MAG: ABC transporter permease, partial [Saprospiraceae bacterium]|nr:ABC transporter permease [Saprospiraceae bacterium]